jgi:hypothetical protein
MWVGRVGKEWEPPQSWQRCQPGLNHLTEHTREKERSTEQEDATLEFSQYLKAYNLLLSNSLTLLTMLSFLVSQQLPCYTDNYCFFFFF